MVATCLEAVAVAHSPVYAESPAGHNSTVEELATVSAGLLAMGTILAGSASFLSCFGVNMQKKAHNIEAAKPADERKPLLRTWRWWLGICCMITASCADVAALPFVPLSRVAALGSLTIVANVFICPLFLGEKITKHDLLGALMTVAGTSVACVFGVASEPEIDSDCLLELFADPKFVLFFLGNLIVMAVLFYFIEGFRRTRKRVLDMQLGGLTNFECIHVWSQPQVLNSLTTVIDDRYVFLRQFGPQFYPALMAVYGGMSGVQSIALSKAVLTFLRNAIQGYQPGKSVGLLLAFICPMGMFLYGQIRFLNESLSAYRDSLFVLPVYQCTWILLGIASGLIFYQEYRELSAVGASVSFLGVLLSLAGVHVLTRRVGVEEAASCGSPCSGESMQTSSFTCPVVTPLEDPEAHLGEAAHTPLPRRASFLVWPPPAAPMEPAQVPTVSLGVGSLRLRSTSVMMVEGFRGGGGRTPRQTSLGPGRSATAVLGMPLLRDGAGGTPDAAARPRAKSSPSQEALTLARSATAPSRLTSAAQLQRDRPSPDRSRRQSTVASDDDDVRLL
eukprot:TRINITY_DN24408_c0_g1_i1.p1 TRINITY_DN24408_c0_g1~~TRINITY_DN24408_c0_g1_i1.p1  ORF type:complete len:561 (+),score=168.09 TRINITY_DN24408_c0_g1_i1:100-1782(+)